jgi:proteasome lid subunit RPN8/RPN11
MNFSIARTINRLFAPQHRLSCSWFLWRRLPAELRRRGKHGRRESGAFLLGRRENNVGRIVDFVPYDDLDPHSLDTGIVRFDGRYYSELWELCKRSGLSVIADVHTHPDGSYQSDSDRANPMISRSGHIAIIVPRFAGPPVRRGELGIYLYEGAKQWRSIAPVSSGAFFQIGL